MERYLNLENLRLALGDQTALPTPEELQELMGEAEVDMFIRHAVIPNSLIKTGWYLHSVASSRRSLELYSFERQRRAHQIASHIFDLAIQKGIDDRTEKLSYVFAAQVGYIRGGLTPNAVAVYKSLDSENASIEISVGDAALEAGVAILALDRRRLFTILPGLRSEIESMTSDNTGRTSLTLLRDLLAAIWNLLLYLSYGYGDALARAQETLESIVRSDNLYEDVDTRWVAAHLLDISKDLGDSSVWAILPPQVPPAAAKAMTLGNPPVLSLWPPQLQLLKPGDQNNPLHLDTRRLLLSVPTSAGKTLLAQFFVLSHLAQGAKGVCFVAPTHSLCREIRQSLEARLRLLKQEVMYDVPFGLLDLDYLDVTQDNTPQVEVMTPEKLSFLLRHNPKETMEKFSLFVIDEAHLISDESRGWGLESTLSLLHMMTRDGENRIVLMSSSLGNRTHLVQWIGVDNSTLTFHNEWRGPRRLYAIYTPEKDENIQPSTSEIADRDGTNTTQFHYELFGTIRLRLADMSQIYNARIRAKVGDLYTRPGPDGRYHPVPRLSTPFYKMLAPLATGVAESGPVLIIVSTRRDAQNLAKVIAERIGREDSAAKPIAELAETRLGSEHLLSKVLKNGVAFHHAALPADLQDAIESGVRSGLLKYIIATTTLVEGVNLPVRTVIIGNTGSYTSDGFHEFINGSRLINAIGRAGRSGKESEGWIILADRFYNADHFNQLMQSRPEDVGIVSQLTSELALSALSSYEEWRRSQEDAVFSAPHSRVSDFMSYIWVVANSYGELNGSLEFSDVETFLASTLAWRQLEENDKARWVEVARLAFDKYQETPEDSRRRWSRSGTSLPTAKRLESFLSDIVTEVILTTLDEEPLTNEGLLDLLLSPEALEAILSFPEAPKAARIRSARNSRRESSIGLDYKAILTDWVDGVELNTLVERYLSEINDREYAYESLGDFIAGVFEHYLPWVLGILISWVNESPVAIGENLVDPKLPAYVHYGVNNSFSVELMMHGIKSRRLAVEIGEQFKATSETMPREWLNKMNVAELRDQFNASESELRDLLAYLRPRDSTLLADLIDGQDVDLGFYIRSASSLDGEVEFRYDDTDELPAGIGIYRNDYMVCKLPVRLYADIEALMDMGLPYKVTLSSWDADLYSISVRLVNFEQNSDEPIILDDIDF